MKICYMPHRGTLKNALEEQQVFQSFEDMLNYIVSNREFFRAVVKEDIYLQYYGFDFRLPAETFVVGFGKLGEEDYIKKFGHPGIFGWVHFKATQPNENIGEIVINLQKQFKNWTRVSDINLKPVIKEGGA